MTDDYKHDYNMARTFLDVPELKDYAELHSLVYNLGHTRCDTNKTSHLRFLLIDYCVKKIIEHKMVIHQRILQLESMLSP